MTNITVIRDGAVARLELSAPPHNHVSAAIVGEIADALHAVDADDAIRAVVLTSAGRVFCGGADLTGDRPLENAEGESETPELYRNAVRCFAARKPIVAAVQGAAVGAGLGLALLADFRVAAPEARFCANFVALGFHAGFGITHALPRVVGLQAASMMLMTGRRLKGEEALAIGLVDELVPLAELPAAAMRLANQIAANAPLAVEATRATLRAGLAEAIAKATDHERAEQDRLMKTVDFAEGLRAVAERRPGNFLRR
ncbi:Enoyl-CoA hydratase [Sphingomonas sp. EC-HK361]|uniref:enoyl-CoA hydratase/isomerase family protein n=1 Tax=Sphingomonas sp. EC-HK361 TaxID=2038397 RepID=UPI00125A6FA5|nr:enoyl-CoA hydratase/isomerase family protein [Sphingomonas sp. EC-HK361]VVT13597.1 Enoyl-CoA hydratase [Sphingomonas sp. EC-HK361]